MFGVDFMNETVFKQLFVQLIELSLKQSVPEDSEIPQPDQELAFYRIERIGFQVGQRLVSRLIMGHRLFTDQLDILKYICKDYWLALFQKQIDNLKTNHKVKKRKYAAVRIIHFIIIFRVFLCYRITISLGFPLLHLIFPCQTLLKWLF